jgi:hypothetical protein
MNRKLFPLASATLLILAAGCGDEAPAGPPPGIDPKASQTSPVTSAPAPSNPGKAAKRGEVHRPGPSMTLQ